MPNELPLSLPPAASSSTPRTAAAASPVSKSGALRATNAPTAAAAGTGLYVGTSGYSYPEWVDAGFYPPSTKQPQMLGLYLARFPAVELNYTWYQLPKADGIERQRRMTPPAFRFAAKLTRTLTHEIDAAWMKQADAYRDGIAPLIEARQLAAVLVQLAPDFTYTVASRRYLGALIEHLEGLPLAVEFRHASWAKPRVYAELARRQVALVAVDAPALPQLFPPVAEATRSDWFYVRFHGRNLKGWQSGQAEQKFHYDYTDKELAPWLETRIAHLSERAPSGYVFFNNHYGGLAPKNALAFQRLAAKKGLKVLSPS
ncbi:MAG TPA: DUF72 domain-containing protein [Planctomycetota bacterium]|nr:DUF72 domain-containing protein [Planctomycetota bacterium]